MVDIQLVSQEFKASLQALYGDRLAEVILFGSYARGDFHEESDVDFAVVLKDLEVLPYKEISNISPFSSEIGMKYSMIVSFLPVSKHRLENSMMPVYQEIRKEGIKI